MNWLHYLLEANLYLAVFYAVYYLLLSRETYYTLNRVYLLFSCVISFVLPMLQLDMLKSMDQPVIAAATVTQSAFEVQPFNTYPVQFVPVAEPRFTLADGLLYAYFAGTVVLLLILLVKLYRLYKLTRVENFGTGDDCKVIYLDRSTTAFSFFNYLFIGTKVHGPETIIKHELVHIRQKHSADIIFIELLKVVNWFNPVMYLLQYSIKTLHEYIADEQTAASEADALTYSAFLVNNAYGLDGASVTNSFFNYNLLKKRIIMLNQKRSGSLARLKYLLAVPVFAGALCASTLAFSKNYGWVNIGPNRIDKNNHTPQVQEPNRRLLVQKNGMTTITDKFSYKRDNGTVRVYTPYNLSNKDVVDLKKKGIEVKVLYDVKVDTNKTGGASTATQIIKLDDHQPVQPVMKLDDHQPAQPVVMMDDHQPAQPVAIRDTDKSGTGVIQPYNRPAPPPPAPPVLKEDGRPAPPPPAPPLSNTKKGYKYREDGYVINGKTDFRVIITTKSGDEKAYFKSKSSDSEKKMLRDKYGYIFPKMDLHTKLPPPPPEPPAPAPKHAAVAPGTSPEYKHLIYSPNKAPSTGEIVSAPVIVVNGEIYKMATPLKKGQQIVVDAAGGENAVMYTDKDLAYAIVKYGPNAKNGVIFATGKTKVTVEPAAPVKTDSIAPKTKANVTKPKNSIYDDREHGWEYLTINTSKRDC